MVWIRDAGSNLDVGRDDRVSAGVYNADEHQDPASRNWAHRWSVRARDYYLQAAFEIDVRFGGMTFNAADGGLVDWTQQLLANRKERLMISGIGIDRVAIARNPSSQLTSPSLPEE